MLTYSELKVNSVIKNYLIIMTKKFNDLIDVYNISEKVFSDETIINKNFSQMAVYKLKFIKPNR